SRRPDPVPRGDHRLARTRRRQRRARRDPGRAPRRLSRRSLVTRVRLSARGRSRRRRAAVIGTDRLSRELFAEDERALCRRANQFFVVLLGLEWIVCVALALWMTPVTWSGLSSKVHPHVPIAFFLGGATAAFPIALCRLRPYHPSTRHCVAVAQMVFASLLVQ